MVGTLHSLPGADPVQFAYRRSGALPLTDVRIRFECGLSMIEHRVGTLVVNLDIADEVLNADGWAGSNESRSRMAS